MNNDQLKTGNDLSKLIGITDKALRNLENWIEQSQNNKNLGSSYKTDNNYNLSISVHSDGSGHSLNLARYYGNTKLLQSIKKELENQLEEFKKDFENL